MPRRISEERKIAYYIGMALQLVGLLLFASTFVTFVLHFGDFEDFQSRVKSDMFRALSGMALMVIGGLVRGVGARGLAGSGVLLDPEKARGELEPYSRMAGGMVKDAIDEAGLSTPGAPKPLIMLKCGSCGTLNPESAKFCQECGIKI